MNHYCEVNSNSAGLYVVFKKLATASDPSLMHPCVPGECGECGFGNLDGNELDFSQLLPEDEYSKFNECLSRPIFSPIGHDKFRFSHSSYFDFLAAMGVVELIEQSEWSKFVLSPEGVPYPQWEGVVPWLAARDDALLERVKKCRPDLLLASDAVVSKVSADEICRSILDNVKSIPRTTRDNPAIQARYYALTTDGCIKAVVDSLKSSQSDEVLDTAIDIARRARVLPMIDALVELFCDESRSMDLRVSAGYVLIQLANAEQRRMCRSVISASLPKRLKGVVLRLLWPDYMTVDELVPLLSAEEDNVYDAYESWLGEFPNTITRISLSDKRAVLKWAINDINQDKTQPSHNPEG